MIFTWSISEKWTFFGLIFPSSDSESLLLGSGTSKLGFFRRDLRGVALDCGRCPSSTLSSSIIVGSSTELQMVKDIVFRFSNTFLPQLLQLPSRGYRSDISRGLQRHRKINSNGKVILKAWHFIVTFLTTTQDWHWHTLCIWYLPLRG